MRQKHSTDQTPNIIENLTKMQKFYMNWKPPPFQVERFTYRKFMHSGEPAGTRRVFVAHLKADKRGGFQSGILGT